MTDHQPCLSAETLAVLAAGQLSAVERTLAEAHLAACVDCRDIYGDVLRFAPPAAPKAAIYWGRRSWVGLAAAAALVLTTSAIGYRVWNSPERQVDRALTRLASSLDSPRVVEARLSGPFAWAPKPTTTRGIGEGALAFDAEEAILDIRRLSASHRSPRALAASGVASLVEGDLDRAIEVLTEAAALSGADANVYGNLSAAYAERWRRGRVTADAAAALDAAERALLQSPADPVARFNHALAVEGLGLRDAAIASWQKYLEVDGESSWANEARDHVRRLQESAPLAARARLRPPAPASWPPARRECYARGYADLEESRRRFNGNELTESESLARRARQQLACAGAATAEADAELAWSLFFQNRMDEGVALATQLLAAAGAGTAVPPTVVGRMHYVVGLGHQRGARHTEADAHYVRAIAAFELDGDVEMAASVSVLRGQVRTARSDVVGTWEMIAPALPAVHLLAPRRRHLALFSATHAAQTFGQLGAAKFFAETLVAANATTDPVIAVGALVTNANVLLDLNRHAEALTTLDRAASLLVGADPTMREQYETEIEMLRGRGLERSNPAAAVAALDEVLRDFDAPTRPLRRARALLVRGRALKAADRAREAEHDWLEATELFEDRRPDLRDEQWRIDQRDELWDLFRELIRLRADDATQALDVAERFRGRALLESVARDTVPTPKSGRALYEWLPSDVTVISYTVLPDGLYRWTVTSTGADLVRLPVTAADLTRDVDAHVAALAQNRVDVPTALSSSLLPAGLDASKTTRLVFLPDGPLHRLPFATLPLPGAEALVIDRFVTLVAPSLTVLEASGDARSRSNAMVVTVGAAHQGEGLPALPGVSAERQAIAPVYPQALLLDGVDATAEKFLAEVSSHDVIHFAGHVIADPVAPSRSRLLLSPAGDRTSVTFNDLRGLRMQRGAVVVLSGCESARGRVFTGEGAIGLPHVFLANGASAVVAALWPIDDAATPALWKRFHERIRHGVAPDLALAESQRESRRAGASAAVWAAFETVGGLVR